MAKIQKKCFVVRVCADNDWCRTITHAEYLGSELGFQVWYKQLQRGLAVVHPDKKLFFPFYSYPVEG